MFFIPTFDSIRSLKQSMQTDRGSYINIDFNTSVPLVLKIRHWPKFFGFWFWMFSISQRKTNVFHKKQLCTSLCPIIVNLRYMVDWEWRGITFNVGHYCKLTSSSRQRKAAEEECNKEMFFIKNLHWEWVHTSLTPKHISLCLCQMYRWLSKNIKPLLSWLSYIIIARIQNLIFFPRPHEE